MKLVSSVDGRLVQDVNTPEHLESLVRWEPEPAVAGEDAQLTVDNNSCAGYAWLLHGDASVVEADYNELLQLQNQMFVVSSGRFS